MRIESDRTFGTRECPNCAMEVPANHNRCPICQHVFLRPSPLQRNLKLGGALLMLALFLILIFGLM